MGRGKNLITHVDAFSSVMGASRGQVYKIPDFLAMSEEEKNGKVLI